MAWRRHLAGDILSERSPTQQALRSGPLPAGDRRRRLGAVERTGEREEKPGSPRWAKCYRGRIGRQHAQPGWAGLCGRGVSKAPALLGTPEAEPQTRGHQWLVNSLGMTLLQSLTRAYLGAKISKSLGHENKSVQLGEGLLFLSDREVRRRAVPAGSSYTMQM